MELKKTPKADLENKRGLFARIGLVVSLGLCLLAFEWNTKVEPVTLWETTGPKSQLDENVIITYPEIKPPPPPPKVVDMIIIVDNNANITDEPTIEIPEPGDPIINPYSIITNEKEPEKDNEEPFIWVENMPEFPGGEPALRRFLANAVKYPVVAVENGIQGKVLVNFIVDKDGNVINATIFRGVDPSLDKEALRVVNSLSKWKPGMQGGKAVRVSYTVPITFVLQ